jgi:hypothetical protein
MRYAHRLSMAADSRLRSIRRVIEISSFCMPLNTALLDQPQLELMIRCRARAY